MSLNVGERIGSSALKGATAGLGMMGYQLFVNRGDFSRAFDQTSLMTAGLLGGAVLGAEVLGNLLFGNEWVSNRIYQPLLSGAMFAGGLYLMGFRDNMAFSFAVGAGINIGAELLAEPIESLMA